EKLATGFEKYAVSAMQEKLYMHTDKGAYTAGELIWLKIYAVDGIKNQPLGISKVAYVELLDHDQNAVLQSKIALSDGSGNGSLYLPVALNTGKYTIRAYTNWMKNFGADYFFAKQLTIINPLKSPADAHLANNKTAYDIQFFPEGGKLINGISSVVGFKGIDQWGHSASFKGIVMNEKNDTVARFETLKFGMGRFSLTPQTGSTYHAVIFAGSQRVEVKLPTAISEGYAMKLSDDGSNQLKVTVSGNAAGKVYLFAQTHHIIKSIQTATVNNTATFTINKDKLGDGISQFTVFDEQKRPVCERLYFKKPAKFLQITTQTDASVYDQRHKVTLNGTIGNQVTKADLSLAVYRTDTLQADKQEHILSYLFLRSDLKGWIEDPDYYFISNDSESQLVADNLMLTQGWRTFDWQAIQSGNMPVFKFTPEYNGPVITAKVAALTSGTPIAGVVGYLGIVGKSVQVSVAKSDENGRLSFNMHNFYGPAEIVAETDTRVDSTYRIDIQSPFSDQHSEASTSNLDITPSLQQTFADRSLAAQVQNVYNGPNLWQFADPHADSSAFYGKPTKVYLLDNYTRFITFEEVMREYIREINVFKSRGNFHIKVVNEYGFLPEGDPMVIVDGVPFFNMNKVFALDPLKFRKLEDVPYRYKLGPSNENGVFSLTSYKGDLGGAEIDPHAVVLDYEGLQKERRFYAPVYETDQQLASRMPDMRSTLYWSPMVTPDVNGHIHTEFYTSDQPGKYIVVMQGLSSDGLAGSGYTSFNVR
ncbi:MAG TPA: hypothetical protein VL442_02795, partial [Mucilaginibacter sp.]|nr:hypothetical protein [Mucilaginibacter sp.]